MTHEPRRTTARSLIWNSGGDASSYGTADVLSRYFFHERRWELEVLHHSWNTKGVLSLVVAADAIE